jgi:hypothetical protein
MTIKDLLTTYWSQVTLILLALGYLVKRILDIKTRKAEINHSLFQQNRITSVKTFFAKYAKAELMWHQLTVYEILDKKLSAKELDKIIFPHLNELQETLLELKIYFDDDHQKYFEQLTKGILSIHDRLLNLYFNSNPEMNTVAKGNDYYSFKEEILKNNRLIMNDLCVKIRCLYN